MHFIVSYVLIVQLILTWSVFPCLSIEDSSVSFLREFECLDNPCSLSESGSCLVYEEGLGCSRCNDGFFKFNFDMSCVNCNSLFGSECLECGDFIGCKKCDNENGYFIAKSRDEKTGINYYYCREGDSDYHDNEQEDEEEERDMDFEFPLFMTQNPFRLQFLGGYHSNSQEMCYDYVLHKHFNKNISMNINVSSLTWSMVICPSDNINGTVSDYLTNVIVDGNYNNNSSYYIDDTRFYYHLTGIDESFNESQITVCFNNNNNNDMLSDRHAETVTETPQFCFYFDDEEEEAEKEGREAICMSRGVFVTDICGLESLGRESGYHPPTSIDFVLPVGKTHDINELHGQVNGNLMSGHGTFSFIPSMVTLRGWWIDECVILGNESDTYGYNMEIVLNDDYIYNYIGNSSNFSSLINCPVTIPDYDRFIVSSSCEHIFGEIVNVSHDSTEEEVILYVNMVSTPLIYFEHANFNIENVTIIEFSDDIEDLMIGYENNGHKEKRLLERRRHRLGLVNRRNNDITTMILQRERRRLKTISFSVGLKLSGSYSDEKDVKYKNRLIATCESKMSAYLSFSVGFKLDYSTVFFGLIPTRLNQIAGFLRARAGFDTFMECVFSKNTPNRWINGNVFTKEIQTRRKYFFFWGIIFNVRAYLRLDIVIQRPALEISVSSDASAHASFSFEAGWKRKGGPYATTRRSFSFDYGVGDIDYPGSSGRLESRFTFYLTPGLKFGLFGFDLLQVGLPLGLPSFKGTLKKYHDSNSDVCINLLFDLDFTVNVEVGVSKIKILGRTIFKGYLWSPSRPLYSKRLARINVLSVCIGQRRRSRRTLLTVNENNYTEYRFGYKYALIYSNSDSSITWSEANSYCNEVYETQLATIHSISDHNQISKTILRAANGDHDGDNNTVINGIVWIGLSENGTWEWSDNSTLGEFDFNDWAIGEPNVNFSNNESYCGGIYLIFNNETLNYSTSEWNVFLCDSDSSTENDVSNFVCDLRHETKDLGKYIGTYIYGDSDIDSLITWNDANDYCFNEFGTELASIHDDSDNQWAYNAFNKLNVIDNKLNTSWIGLTNISNASEFDWVDETKNDYSHWNDNVHINSSSDGNSQCASFVKSTTEWINNDCENQKCKSFVCNFHNLFIDYEYDNYIALFSTHYGLTWSESNDACIDIYGTSLASIHSHEENDLAQEISQFLYDNHDISNIWIGINDINNEGTFDWSDGTQITYTNWNNSDSFNNSNNNDCGELVYVDTDNNKSEWNNENCDNQYHAFLCNRPQTVVEYGNYVGIMTHSDSDESMYTFEEANNYCIRYYGTTLGSVHSLNDSNEIEFVLSNISANGANVAWIGLNDIKNESVYQWTDESEFDYNNWLSNEPNNDGILGEHCVEIVYDSNSTTGWNDNICNQTLNTFICNLKCQSYSYGNYIGIYSQSPKNWTLSNDYCEETFGSTLASIHSSDDNNDVLLIFDELNNLYGKTSSVWIGLNNFESTDDDDDDNDYQWIDDSVYNYGNVTNISSASNCVNLVFNQSEWLNQDCNKKMNGFICNKAIKTFSKGNFSGVYLYKANSNGMNFSLANDYCVDNYNESMASSIDNQIVNDLFLNNLVMEGINSSWININNQSVNNSCGVLITNYNDSNTKSQLTEYDCSDIMYSFICNSYVEPALFVENMEGVSSYWYAMSLLNLDTSNNQTLPSDLNVYISNDENDWKLGELVFWENAVWQFTGLNNWQLNFHVKIVNTAMNNQTITVYDVINNFNGLDTFNLQQNF